MGTATEDTGGRGPKPPRALARLRNAVLDTSPEDVSRAQPSPAGDERVHRRRFARAALIAWGVLVVAVTLRWGLPSDRPKLMVLIALGLLAASLSSPRAWARVLRDWLPLFLLLGVYDRLRAAADHWSTNVHVMPQIKADEWLFGGQIPTVHLQELLFPTGQPHWWDYAVFVVYLSHFFVSLVVLGLLWKFAYPRFRRYAGLFMALTYCAFVTYALYPADPPWLASRDGFIAPTAKIVDIMWVQVGLRSGVQVFSATSHLANPVAAVPSLHSAYPFLLMLFFWQSAGRWRWLLPLYPLAMGFALVYTAEHFVIDVLLGWLYATVVFVVGNAVADAWTRRKARRELDEVLDIRDEPVAVDLVHS